MGIEIATANVNVILTVILTLVATLTVILTAAPSAFHAPNRFWVPPGGVQSLAGGPPQY